MAERNNASISGRILEKKPIFLYLKDYQNAVQKRSIICPVFLYESIDIHRNNRYIL